MRPSTYLRFEASGDCHDNPTVRFDEKRNWAFVRALLQNPKYEVRRIFVYAPIRARLLAYAAKTGAPLDLRAKAAAAMMQPINAQPHDDHFHIRISCPADRIEEGCLDRPLWQAPGPDEFDPDLLAEDAPKIRSALPNAVPPKPGATSPSSGQSSARSAIEPSPPAPTETKAPCAKISESSAWQRSFPTK